MKISIQNLKVLIENFLRENPYDDKEKSKKFDAELEKAEKELENVSLDFERFGGSRAQRDLLEFTYVNVLLRLGKKEDAQKTLLERRPNLYNTAPIAALSTVKI